MTAFKLIIRVWALQLLFLAFSFATDPIDPEDFPEDDSIIRIRIGFDDPLYFTPGDVIVDPEGKKHFDVDVNSWSYDDSWNFYSQVDTNRNGFSDDNKQLLFTYKGEEYRGNQSVFISNPILLKGGYDVRFTIESVKPEGYPTAERQEILKEDSDDYSIAFLNDKKFLPDGVTYDGRIPWKARANNAPTLQVLKYKKTMLGFTPPNVKNIAWEFTPMGPRISLKMQDLSEEKKNTKVNELDPGAILIVDPQLSDPYNNKTPSATPVKIRFWANGIYVGKIKFEVTGDQNTIELFEDPLCKKPFPKIKEWDIDKERAKIPTVLYVRGVKESMQAQGTQLKISMTLPDESYFETLKVTPDIINITVVNPQIFVDANRDGEINTEEDPADNVSDKTDIGHPYRFWVNDDDDYSIGVAGDTTGENVPVAKSDSDDPGVIDGVRDLEDFARLNIKVGPLHNLLADGKLKLGMKWINMQSGGTPSLNLYKSTDQENGGEGYLTDLLTAKLQMKEGFVGKKLQAAGSTVSYIDKTAFTGTIPTDKIWKGLFEGCAPGKGQLSLVISQPDGKVMVESKGAWVDLKNIKSMYERAMATPETISNPYETTGPTDDPPEPSMGFTSDVAGFPYEAAGDEDINNKNYIVFVHGWNMSYQNSQNYAETMFKRLWWRGYKGRFAAFRWQTYSSSIVGIDPIDAYLAHYNESEYIAWKSGKSLKQYVASLSAGYTKNIVAHSMGNIVAGSALKEGMFIANYALLNAAVPAACYDINMTLTQAPGVGSINLTYWDTPTPDGDADSITRALGYRGQLQNITGNLVSFFLPRDIATTTAWEFNNNSFKPYDPLGSGQYFYNPNAAAGQRLGISFVLGVGRFVRTPHEAMAYVSQSPTKVVGAEGRTRGSIDDSSNLDDNYSFGADHSAEFNLRIQEVVLFYGELLSKLNIRQNP